MKRETLTPYFGAPVLFTLFLTVAVVCLAFPGILNAKSAWTIHDDILSLSFPTQNEGWASGRWGTILYTADGGKTWSRQNSVTEGTLVAIHFTDPENGWAVGSKGTIVHTADGGRTWVRQSSPVDYYHMGVYFINPLKGWIISERTHILTTDDGGLNWRVQFKDEDFVLKGLSFADDQHGWAVGEFGYTYYTADGGQTWTNQAGYYDLDYETGELVGDPTLFDVVALNKDTAWAVGLDGHVIMTVDGGATWAKQNVGAPAAPLYCIAAGRGGTLVIGGKGAGLVSDDSGRTWKKAGFRPSMAYSWIYGIARRGDTAKFAAGGEAGAIYLSNSHEHWKRINY